MSEHLVTAEDAAIIKRALRAYAGWCADRANSIAQADESKHGPSAANDAIQEAKRAGLLAESLEVTTENCVTIPERMFLDLMKGKYAAYALSASFRAMTKKAYATESNAESVVRNGE